MLRNEASLLRKFFARKNFVASKLPHCDGLWPPPPRFVSSIAKVCVLHRQCLWPPPPRFVFPFAKVCVPTNLDYTLNSISLYHGFYSWLFMFIPFGDFCSAATFAKTIELHCTRLASPPTAYWQGRQQRKLHF